jgi:hypothetical protein
MVCHFAVEGRSGGSFWDRLNSLGREYAVLQPGTTVLWPGTDTRIRA